MVENCRISFGDFKMTITREQVEQAIDLFVSLEPTDPMISSGEYDAIMSANSSALDMAANIIHQYGGEISPQTLKRMQDEYYSFTNSLKYLKNATVSSVARSVLSENWNGINEWRD